MLLPQVKAKSRVMARTLMVSLFLCRLFIFPFTSVLDVNWDELRVMEAHNVDFVETLRLSLLFSLNKTSMLSFNFLKPSLKS
jgi:hypothetical protein